MRTSCKRLNLHIPQRLLNISPHLPITSLFTVLSQTAESACFAQVVQCCRKLCGGIQNLANNACVDACESNVLWSAWFSGDKESKVKEYLPQIRPVLTCFEIGIIVEGFPLRVFKLHLCETSRHKLEGAIRDNTDELAKVLTQERRGSWWQGVKWGMVQR